MLTLLPITADRLLEGLGRARVPEPVER
jgi:hypothetical protein